MVTEHELLLTVSSHVDFGMFNMHNNNNNDAFVILHLYGLMCDVSKASNQVTGGKYCQTCFFVVCPNILPFLFHLPFLLALG